MSVTPQIDTVGGTSYIKGKGTVANILSQFLVWTHQDLPDGSPGKKYPLGVDKVPARVVCTQDFWKEFAYYVVFTYGVGKALKPDTVDGYLHKAMGIMNTTHSGVNKPFFDTTVSAKGAPPSWWAQVVSSAWKRAAEIRHTLGLSNVSFCVCLPTPLSPPFLPPFPPLVCAFACACFYFYMGIGLGVYIS